MRRLLLTLLLGWGMFALLPVLGQTPMSQTAASVPPAAAGTEWPLLVRACQDDARCRQWVDSVMAGMDLQERIGQLFVYTIAPTRDKANRNLLRRVVEDYHVGGLLFSGGEVADQVALTNEAQSLARVPLMLTFDGEWGLAMRLKHTPQFPRNMVLGCISNDSLIVEYGREMARQCREMGVSVNFAPVADVNINPDNPVINTRSFGEDPQLVARKVLAYASGLESGGVLSVCKHFPGHGDTDVDSHHALPALPFSRQRLDSVELYPFRQAIRAGLGAIMVGHLEVPAIEPQRGLPSSLSRRVVTGLLTDEMDFRGLVFTDALVMKGVGKGQTTCLQALMAGCDVLLVPPRIKEERQHIVDAVKHGRLPRQVIDDKCRKVLTYKYALGLTQAPHVRLSGLHERLDRPQTRQLISRLKQAAVTVASNREALLPLDPSLTDVAVLHVGRRQDLEPFVEALSAHVRPHVFQVGTTMGPAARQRLADSLSAYRRVLVCVTARKTAAWQPVLDALRPSAPMACLFFTPSKQLLPLSGLVRRAGAVVVAHSADSEVQRHVAEVLCGRAVADGRLSASIGRLFPVGAGVTIGPATEVHVVPEDHGMDARWLSAIDTIAREGIDKGAYPGCQIVIMKDGAKVYDKAFGHLAYPGRKGGAVSAREVTPDDVYDLASLTKTTATLLAVMKLYDGGRISLNDPVGRYLPFLQGTDKQGITIRQLLLHESGLPSTLLFYREAIDEDSYTGGLFKGRRDALHPVRIGSKTWANPHFRFKDGLTSRVPSADYPWQVADSLWLHRSFRQVYLQQIAEAPLLSRRYRYSCVGFIVLQQVVEACTGMRLDAYLEKEFYGPMGLKHTGFLPLHRLSAEELVPSAIDGFLRKDVLRGYVHDESAAFQGGVSGNAGLFSNAREVAAICQMLLNGGELNGRRYLSAETCRLFTTTVSRISRRGLGFDKPDVHRPASSPCAPCTPASVYGHTGFTGTCAWIDPDNRLVYVFISNRLYPEVWNTRLMRLDIRTRIQETMYRALSH